MAAGRLCHWVVLELKKLIKLPWFPRIQPPAPTRRSARDLSQQLDLLETADKTAALCCAMPPRQCRVIMVARCHDLPRDLALVRKRHRTVGNREDVLRTCFYQSGPGVSSRPLLGLRHQQHVCRRRRLEPVELVYSTNRKLKTSYRGQEEAIYTRHCSVPFATK